MPRVLILAYGNPMRGDDGLGWHAAQALAGDADGDEVQVMFSEQLTPDLAEPVSLSRRIIFVDASATSEPGCVASAPVQPSTEPPGSFSHEITPASLLAWAQTLYGASPQAVMISVGGESFELGAGLSAPVAKSLPSLLACVREHIAAARVDYGGE